MMIKNPPTYGRVWKFLPTLKLAIVAARALVFFLVLAKAEANVSSVNLLSFWSYVVIIGIILSLGSTDALLAAKEATLIIIRKIISLLLISLLILIYIIYSSELLLIVSCGIAFGCNQWTLGDLRRYSFIYYEVASVLIMLVVWLIYLLSLGYETESFSVLTSIMLGVSLCFLGITSYVRHSIGFAINKISQSSQNIAISKIMWETAYASVTRFPFLYLQSHNIPPILPYVYYLSELISVAFGHLQSIFLSQQLASDEYKRKKLVKIFSSSFILVYLLFGIILIYASGSDLQWITTFLQIFHIVIEIDLSLLVEFQKKDILAFIVLMAVMQLIAFGRYGLRLFDNLPFSGVAIIVALAFGSLMLAGSTFGLQNSLFGGGVLLLILILIAMIVSRFLEWRFY